MFSICQKVCCLPHQNVCCPPQKTHTKAKSQSRTELEWWNSPSPHLYLMLILCFNLQCEKLVHKCFPALFNMPWRLQVTFQQLWNRGPVFDVLHKTQDGTFVLKRSGIEDDQLVVSITGQLYKGEHSKTSSVAGQAFSKQPEATCCVRDWVQSLGQLQHRGLIYSDVAECVPKLSSLLRKHFPVHNCSALWSSLEMLKSTLSIFSQADSNVLWWDMEELSVHTSL